MFFKEKTAKAKITPLSNFVRNTSSREKKKIYEKVLVAASNSQNLIIEKAVSLKASCAKK